MIEVPSPYSAHPGSAEDIDDIWRLMVAVNTAEAGMPGFGQGEMRTWLTGAWITLAEDVITVRAESGEIVGVEIFDSRDPYVRPHCTGGVHPDHLGRGLGESLLRWGIRRAEQQLDQAAPGTRVTLNSLVAHGHEPSAALMGSLGLELNRYFIDMEIDFAGRPAAPAVPGGITIRSFDPAEVETLAFVTQEGFRDHYGFVESPMELRIARLRHWMDAADHDPTLWWVAEDAGNLVGFNLCWSSHQGDESVGFVGSLAVLRPHRGRGLGRALLLTSLLEFFDRGKEGAALGVDADSLTGATRLYQSVGMRPGANYAAWELEMRPGIELATLEIAGS